MGLVLGIARSPSSQVLGPDCEFNLTVGRVSPHATLLRVEPAARFVGLYGPKEPSGCPRPFWVVGFTAATSLRFLVTFPTLFWVSLWARPPLGRSGFAVILHWRVRCC